MEKEKQQFNRQPAIVKLINNEEIMIKDLIEFGPSLAHGEQDYLYGLIENGSVEIPARSILYVIHLKSEE